MREMITRGKVHGVLVIHRSGNGMRRSIEVENFHKKSYPTPTERAIAIASSPEALSDLVEKIDNGDGTKTTTRGEIRATGVDTALDLFPRVVETEVLAALPAPKEESPKELVGAGADEEA